MIWRRQPKQMLCEVEEGGGLEIKEMSERKELVSEKK